jgi:carboxyl-terminal processing protease
LLRSEEKRDVRFLALILIFFAICVFGCDGDQDVANGSNSANSGSAAIGDSSEAQVAVNLACEKILIGDFEGAGEIVEKFSEEGGENLDRLGLLVGEYKLLEAKRQELKGESYEEQIAELMKYREKAGSEYAVEVNDIDDIFAILATAAEYTDEVQKKALLEEGFSKAVIAKSIAQAAEYEAEGRWTDAYAVCYYWLRNLYKDNAEYKERAESLVEKGELELTLMDDGCDMTSAQRHAGIKSDMLVRAIRAMNLNYVSMIDYNEMANKALGRCLVLSEVIMKSQKELAYSIDAEEAKKWAAGIEMIRNPLKDSLVAVTKDKFERIYDEVLALNKVTIDLPEEVVVAQFTGAALKSLDPFTALFWPSQIEEFEKSMTQQFSGIGVEISKATGVLRVVSLLPNTPAYTSGLDADDEILFVDGEPTDDMTIYCAVDKITGPKGTPVTLTIRRADSEETEDITITRGRIVVPPLRGWQRDDGGKWRYMIDPVDKIGYIRLTAFTENTAPDMEKVLTKLEGEGLAGLILDLRFNSGGYLLSAAQVADMFIESGLIVRSQPRWSIPTYEVAHKKGTHPNYPLVILINGSSASASEIVAGALQDEKYRRATLVGSRTYGKGSVQVVVPHTGGGSQLKYTMAYYHLPSDQRVKNRYVMEKEGREDWGIAPDVEIKLKPKELRKMVDVQRANDVLVKADHDDSSKPVKRYSLKETLESDPQLQAALLVVKSKLVRASVNKELNVKHRASADLEPVLKD